MKMVMMLSVELSDEQYEVLGGLSLYLNYLQNNWGPESQVGTYDYTQKTRLDFEMFLSNHPQSEFPIEFDMETAMASLHLRQDLEARENRNSNRSETPTSISTSSAQPNNQLRTDWKKGCRPISHQ